MNVSGKATTRPALRALLLGAVAAGALVMTPVPAHAYLDPGTGSYILQALIAGLLGAGLVVKTFWRGIAAFFSRIFGRGAGTKDGT